MQVDQHRPRVNLERQIGAARQLRADTLGGGAWIIGAFSGAFAVIRRVILLIPVSAVPA